MRYIDVYYDNTEYILRWLKPLFWSRKEFIDHGITVNIKGCNTYLSSRLCGGGYSRR